MVLSEPLGDAALEDALRWRTGRAPCDELPIARAGTGTDDRAVCSGCHAQVIKSPFRAADAQTGRWWVSQFIGSGRIAVVLQIKAFLCS